MVFEFAVDEADEDGVGTVFLLSTGGLGPVAQDEAESVGRLMPASTALAAIGLFSGSEGVDAGLLVRIGEVGCGEAVAQQFGEGAAVFLAGHLFRLVLWGAEEEGEVVVDVGFVVRREEKHPILLDWGSGFWWVACELGEVGVGF